MQKTLEDKIQDYLVGKQSKDMVHMKRRNVSHETAERSSLRRQHDADRTIFLRAFPIIHPSRASELMPEYNPQP
jgi:hypothetical protein